MADAARDVVIRLKVESHQANAQTATSMAKTIGQVHAEAAKTATQSLEAQRRTATRVLQDLESANSKRITIAEHQKKTLEDLSKAHSTYMDKVIAEAKSEAQLRQDQLKRTTELATSQVDAAEAAHEMGLAMNQARMGASHLLTGVEQVARGVVLLGISSEEHLEKVVRTFARFQASADIIRGVINTGYGAVRMYRAYQTALEAAAAAQSALTAAELAGAAARGRGAAATAGASVLGRGGFAAAGVAAVPVVGQVAVGVATGLAAITAVSPGFRDALMELTGWTDRAADAQKRAIEFENQRIEIAQVALEKEHAARRSVQVFANKEQAFLDYQLQQARIQDQSNPIDNDPFGRQRALLLRKQAETRFEERQLVGAGRGESAERSRLADLQKSIADELIALKQEELRIDRQAAEERIHVAERHLTILQTQSAQAQAQLRNIQASSRQAFAQFATSEPHIRDRLQNLERKRQAGEAFSSQEAQFILQHSPFRQQREAAEKQLAAQGRATAGPLAGIFQPSIDAARRDVRELELKIQNEHNVKVQLEADADRVARAIADQLKPLYGDEFIANMKKIVAEELSQKSDTDLRERTRRAANGQ